MVTQRKKTDATGAVSKTSVRAAKAAIRREQILEAALELFCTHGYAGTSTKRIAEAVGVTEGLVFHYFENKDALLVVLLSRRDGFAGRILTRIQKVADGTARQLLFAVADTYGQITQQEAAFLAFVHAETQSGSALRSQLQAGSAAVNEGFAAMLALRRETNEVRKDADLEVAIQGFFGGFHLFFGNHRDLSANAWRKAATKFAASWADLCWRGIATLESQSEHSTNVTKGRKR